jgi:poly(3-hydroxybutyrate) depolymerase
MHGNIRAAIALAFVFSASLSSVLAAPSPGCGKTPTLTSTTYNTTINGKSRQYILKLPENYDNNRPYRLVFTLHAFRGSANQIATARLPYYGLPALANNSAIFISPDGLNQGWANEGGEDLKFVDDMIKTVEQDLCIDQSLRFATGFSYGGGMSYSLACSRSKDFRAVAILSGATLSGCEGGSDPVAFYIQHGTNDTSLPIARGRELRDRFIKNNGCTPLATEPAPSEGKSSTTAYTGCSPGHPVTWVVFEGGHVPSPTDPGSNSSFTPANTWGFFSQFK